MPNVSSVISATPSLRDVYYVPQAANRKSSLADSSNRENDLTRQLDESLTDRLAQIRSQLGTSTSVSGSPDGLGATLDIRA